MKITRYYQSCVLYEGAEARILIDPSAEEKSRMNIFGKLDAVFYTHIHPDHFDEELAIQFVKNNVAIFCNSNVGLQLDVPHTLTDEVSVFQVGQCAVQSIEIAHCLMSDGSDGPQNTGYFINGEFFHPGDGSNIEGLASSVAALPINGADISMKDAFEMGRNLGANTVIPIHYDVIGGNPEVYAAFAKRVNQPFDMVPLQIGQALNL